MLDGFFPFYEIALVCVLYSSEESNLSNIEESRLTSKLEDPSPKFAFSPTKPTMNSEAGGKNIPKCGYVRAP